MEEVQILKFENTSKGQYGCHTGMLLDREQSYGIYYYKSSWGREFQKETAVWSVGNTFSVACVAGRSSHGVHPFFRMGSEAGHILAVMVAWSGNWYVRVKDDGSLEAGLSEKETTKTWMIENYEGESSGASQERVPALYIFQTMDGDWDHLTQWMHSWGRNMLYPPTEDLPVEWNHWWTFVHF